MTAIAVTVNGVEHVLAEPVSVRELLARLNLPERGIAVAIEGQVLPRSEWEQPVQRGWELEVLTAVQGG